MSESDAGGVQLETRFASLEDASRRLSGDVTALNATLTIVNELQKRQREQTERQLATELSVQAAREESAGRDKRTRRVLLIFTAAMAILLPIVSILVYVSLIQHVDELLAAQNSNSYTNCQIRNQGAKDNITREQALAAAEKDVALRQIHVQSATDLAKSLIDCSKYLKKK